MNIKNKFPRIANLGNNKIEFPIEMLRIELFRGLHFNIDMNGI